MILGIENIKKGNQYRTEYNLNKLKITVLLICNALD